MNLDPIPGPCQIPTPFKLFPSPSSLSRTTRRARHDRRPRLGIPLPSPFRHVDVVTGEPNRGGSIALARKPTDAAISGRKWCKLKSQALHARGATTLFSPPPWPFTRTTEPFEAELGVPRNDGKLPARETIQIADGGLIAVILVFHHDYYFTNPAY
jgi:hypothetical protein